MSVEMFTKRRLKWAKPLDLPQFENTQNMGPGLPMMHPIVAHDSLHPVTLTYAPCSRICCGKVMRKNAVGC